MVPKPEEQEWVCNRSSFCSLVRRIYQINTDVKSACFEETEDEEEKERRDTNLSQVGYLQEWQYKEARLFDLSQIASIKALPALNIESADSVIDTICSQYLIAPDDIFVCDGSLSVVEKTENRFSLLEKLSISRQKMNSCITGYGASFKQNLSRTEVFNCLEGIRHQTLDKLVITEGFPYPDKSGQGYQNCYPYNSDTLTKEQKTKCFNNIERVDEGSSNPGCQVEVKDYMDNYYCCK